MHWEIYPLISSHSYWGNGQSSLMWCSLVMNDQSDMKLWYLVLMPLIHDYVSFYFLAGQVGVLEWIGLFMESLWTSLIRLWKSLIRKRNLSIAVERQLRQADTRSRAVTTIDQTTRENTFVQFKRRPFPKLHLHLHLLEYTIRLVLIRKRNQTRENTFVQC